MHCEPAIEMSEQEIPEEIDVIEKVTRVIFA
jgi:hypothetical protein